MIMRNDIVYVLRCSSNDDDTSYIVYPNPMVTKNKMEEDIFCVETHLKTENISYTKSERDNYVEIWHENGYYEWEIIQAKVKGDEE